MADNLIGVVVSSESVDVVVLQQNGAPPFTLQTETTFKLQMGDRANAYRVLHDQFVSFVKRHHATQVCLKKSALSLRGMKMVHLEAAELRGVVQCAAIVGGAEIRLFNRASASRASGKAGGRDVNAYLKDDTHWDSLGLSELSKGRREAAFAVVEEFSP
jgi:hypothetical protein